MKGPGTNNSTVVSCVQGVTKARTWCGVGLASSSDPGGRCTTRFFGGKPRPGGWWRTTLSPRGAVITFHTAPLYDSTYIIADPTFRP